MEIKKASIILMLLGKMMYCQSVSIPLEMLSSQEDFYYQHSFYKKISKSKFSFFNLTSLKINYEKEVEKNSYLVRNQLFYEIHKNWNLGLTGELTSSGELIRLGLQYLFKNKILTISLYSNITVSSSTSFVNMLYLEYKPKLTNKLNIYSRLQIQTTNSFSTVRYSNLYRLGVEYKSLKFGIGIPWFNPFNTKKTGTKDVGLFLGIIL